MNAIGFGEQMVSPVRMKIFLLVEANWLILVLGKAFTKRLNYAINLGSFREFYFFIF